MIESQIKFALNVYSFLSMELLKQLYWRPRVKWLTLRFHERKYETIAICELSQLKSLSFKIIFVDRRLTSTDNF